MADEYVKIEMSKREWQDVLIDLDALLGPTGLEPGSKALVELLGWRGVEI